MPYKDRKSAKTLYREKGICVSCCGRPASGELTTCDHCREIQKRCRELKLIRESNNINLGLCRCGNERVSELKRCRKCNDQILKYQKKRINTNKDKCIKCLQRPRDLNRLCNICREKTKVQRKERHLRDKTKVLNHYSNGTVECRCCGEGILRFLTIDHINNNGSEHRKKEGLVGRDLYKWLVQNKFPSGFQVLCYNCNLGRDKCEDKICPHVKSSEFIDGLGI